MYKIKMKEVINMTNKNYHKIYTLTADDKETIKHMKLFFNDIQKFGNYILDTAFSNEVIEDYELTIYSNLYKVLEILDTLEVMTENSLINSSLIIVRSLLEVSLQLRYIIDSKDSMKKKATILQMFDIKRTSKNEDLFYSTMENSECYKDYVDIIRDNRYLKWYSYCENKKMNIHSLFDKVNWTNLYDELYTKLNLDTHGLNHMESNIVGNIDDGKFYFKSFRNFDDENSTDLIISILMIIVPLYSQFFNIYKDELNAMKSDWDTFSKKSNNLINSTKLISNLFM